jgi:hypothetical protein
VGAVEESKDIVALLLSSCDEVPVGVLSKAAKEASANIVQMLLNTGADPNEIGGKPLRKAAERGRQDVVRQLLDAGAEVDDDDAMGVVSPLRKAADNGHKDVVEQLLEAGDKGVHTMGSDILADVARTGHKDVVRLLLDAGVKPDKQAVKAAEEGGKDMRRFLQDFVHFTNPHPDPREVVVWNTVYNLHLEIKDMLLQHCAQEEL